MDERIHHKARKNVLKILSLIKNYLGTKDRYYVRFNKIVFEDKDDDGDIDEIKIEEEK